MQIQKWNDIMDKFIDLVGYDEGVNYVTTAKQDLYAEKYIYELSSWEDRVLTRKLRNTYVALKNKKEHQESISKRRKDNPS